MKKRSLIVVPMLAVLIIIAALLIMDQRQTPAWKTKLDRFLTFLQETGQHSYHVVSAAQAAFPRNFSPDMSAESFSDSMIFESTHILNSEYSSDLQPMPYPPEEVMCVLLILDGQQQLVYVALHNSLYNADWIVHISPDPWGSSTLQSQLKNLGCALDT